VRIELTNKGFADPLTRRFWHRSFQSIWSGVTPYTRCVSYDKARAEKQRTTSLLTNMGIPVAEK
jgi:hypothetical protein